MLLLLCGKVCFPQLDDPLRFEIHSDSSYRKHSDNYSNYLKLLDSMIKDYKENLKIEKFITYYNDTMTTYFFDRKKIKRYTSIKDAMLANHDSVLYLDLRNNNLKKFPKEIFLFKNLRYLDLTSVYSKEYIDSLPPKIKRKYIENMRKHPRIYGSVAYKPNNIKKIPKDIEQLSSLLWINIHPWDMYIEEYNQLKKLLPNCYIESSTYNIIGYTKDDGIVKRHCICYWLRIGK